MVRCLISVGANLGERARALEAALRLLSCIRDSRLIARSVWYETTPVGGPKGQPAFLNGVVLLDTQLAPHELAFELRRIETNLGRERAERWAARLLDLDLLLYGQVIVEDADLVIPHPRMVCRQFVLQPAREIAGPMVHPPSGWTVAALAEHLSRSPRRVAVIAAHPALSLWLADQLCRIFEAPHREDCSSAADSRGGTPVEWAVPVITAFPHAEGLPRDWPALVLALEGECGNLLAQQPRVRDNAPVTSLAAFRQFVRQCRGGPILRIASSDPQQVIEEALAAVAAAWPS